MPKPAAKPNPGAKPKPAAAVFSKTAAASIGPATGSSESTVSFAFVPSIPWTAAETGNSRIRITSYNVCYTKLLRKVTLTGRVFLDMGDGEGEFSSSGAGSGYTRGSLEARAALRF